MTTESDNPSAPEETPLSAEISKLFTYIFHVDPRIKSFIDRKNRNTVILSRLPAKSFSSRPTALQNAFIKTYQGVLSSNGKEFPIIDSLIKNNDTEIKRMILEYLYNNYSIASCRMANSVASSPVQGSLSEEEAFNQKVDSLKQAVSRINDRLSNLKDIHKTIIYLSENMVQQIQAISKYEDALPIDLVNSFKTIMNIFDQYNNTSHLSIDNSNYYFGQISI